MFMTTIELINGSKILTPLPLSNIHQQINYGRKFIVEVKQNITI